MDWVLEHHGGALLSISSRHAFLRLESAITLFWIVRSLLLGDHNIVSNAGVLFRAPVISWTLIWEHCTLALKSMSRGSLIKEIVTTIMIQIVGRSFRLTFSISWSQSWIVRLLLMFICGTSTVILILVSPLLRLLVVISHHFVFLYLFYYIINR